MSECGSSTLESGSLIESDFNSYAKQRGDAMKKVVKKSAKQTTKKVAKVGGKKSPMSKKQIARLKRLSEKVRRMYDLTMAWLVNLGEWRDGEGKDGLVYCVSPKGIHARKTGWSEYEIYEGRNSQIKYKVTDNELVNYLEENRQKLVDAKARARAKIQANALKAAKKDAEGKSQAELLAKLKSHMKEAGVKFVCYTAQRDGTYNKSTPDKKQILEAVGMSTHTIGAVSRFDFQDEKVVEVYLERKPKEKKNTDGITYMDVLRRVAKYMYDLGRGYYLDVGEVNGLDEMDSDKPSSEWYDDCDEEDAVSLRIGDEDDGGDMWLHWDSVEDFLTATFDGKHYANSDSNGCVSIFAAVKCWAGNYYKLRDRPLVWVVDNLKKLADVSLENPSPEGLMKELDRLGIK